MDDREIVAAIAAGSPEGIAAAYDKYAASLYGYCHWTLHRSADAAEALRDTFVFVAAAAHDLPEPSELRGWLHYVARHECLRRLQTRPATHDEETGGQDKAPKQGGAEATPADATITFRALNQPASTADDPADATITFRALNQPASTADDPAHATITFRAVNQSASTELRTLVRAILAELPPREREAAELHLRHDLNDTDVAIALGLSWSKAHKLTSRACGRLEKAVDALLVARTRRKACPALDELLADWDGHFTHKTYELVDGHIETCQNCTGHRRGTLRPAAFSGLLPLAPLPAELREQTLRRSSSSIPDAATDRRRMTWHAAAAWLTRLGKAIRPAWWTRIEAHRGAAIATVALVMWVVTAASVTVLTFADSHPARALPVQPTVRPSPSSATATVPTTISFSADAKPSLKPSSPGTVTPTPVRSSPAFVPPPPSLSPTPSRSPSPKPSGSPSPSKSSSPSPSSSHTTSPSASPTRSASPSPSRTG